MNIQYVLKTCSEKDAHARHLRHLEEDMEAQMLKVEQRVRKEVNSTHLFLF